MNYQSKGIIGIHLAKKRSEKNDLLDLDIPGASIKPKGNIILILIEHGDGDHKVLWKKISREVKKVFRK